MTQVSIICLCLMGLGACSSLMREKVSNSDELSKNAVFEFLKRKKFYYHQTGKGLPQIDPVLRRRDTLRINGKIYFDKPMNSHLLKYPFSNKSSQLSIPDSLSHIYIFPSNSDHENSYAVIHQFSPLLPTNTPDIFLMEYYIWGNSCEEDDCIRWLAIKFLKFQVKDNKVTYLDAVLLYDTPVFFGIGNFSKTQMEMALPGEKINWQSRMEMILENKR